MKKLTLDEIIRRRRSVRMYKDKDVEIELLEKIVATSRFAPSACNIQPWRFVVVTDKTKVKRIFSESLGGIVSNKWAHSAPVFIVACVKKSLMVHGIAARYKNIPFHLLDMGAAIEHILLKVTELGLGACWIGWFNKGAVKKILNIPRSIEVISLITVGYEAEQDEKRERKILRNDEIIFLNQYGGRFR